eukprot:1320845-Rhodomonas_salina.5
MVRIRTAHSVRQCPIADSSIADLSTAHRLVLAPRSGNGILVPDIAEQAHSIIRTGHGLGHAKQYSLAQYRTSRSTCISVPDIVEGMRSTVYARSVPDFA